MKTALFAAAALILFATTAHAEGEGAGDPFPFRAPPVAVSRSFTFADTGSAAYPDFAGRPGERLALGGAVLPSAGSEGAVQTAASLPRGFTDGSAATMQAQAAASAFARAQLRRGMAPHPDVARHG